MARNMEQFEEFRTNKDDSICNAAYALIVEMLRVDPEAQDEDIQPWDMSIIGEVVDAVEETLKDQGMVPCDPYHTDDEEPCPNDSDCTRKDCPFREKP